MRSPHEPHLPIPKHWSPHQALASSISWKRSTKLSGRPTKEPLLDILLNHTPDEPPDDTTFDHEFTDTDDIPF
ncbi:MAG: hypothetical protein ACREYF_08870 [Gammaproteobacteria bacterium]